MKFQVTMKDPDVLHDSIQDAARCVADKIADQSNGLELLQYEAIENATKEQFGKLCARWFEYGEYLTVEIDTEAQTITVVPVK